ncbi:MAG: GT2 family glycosyltransferase [Arenicella sp.]
MIIPTRDGLAVLKPCIDSILSKTSYPNYKIIVADNGSELAETHEYLSQISQDPRVSIVDYPGEFNYSAINNFAVSKGQSEYVALVNNDIEVIDGDWLTQMMVWASQETVGIVGAKLLFENGKVQHAGVTIGLGNAAGHIHRLEDGDAPGYQLRCLATQNMMAVTAACLVTPRALFEELGGLDEVAFKVAYNDIDYCLRVESKGHQVIWTPEAVLHHHESVSRGDDMSEQHIERYFRELEVFQSRWKSKGFVDKYYSKHLRISDEGVFPQVQRQEQDELVSLI